MKKKILIVGGSGFIGYHLAKKCLDHKWDVTSLSSRKPNKIRKLKKVNYRICDISKFKIIKKNIKGNYNYVVNLGGYVNHKNKIKTYQSHYLGCKNLCDFFLDKNIDKFIQVGSSIENGKQSSPQKETKKIEYTNIPSTYGQSKLKATNYLLKLFRQNKFPAIILRLYLAYGPRQDNNRFIPIIINSCLKNKKFDCSEGKQYRDFIYIDDVVSVIMKSLKSNIIGEIFNIGTGKPKQIKFIIKKIKKLINKGEPNYGKIKMRKDEIMKLYPNINKAKTKLNWKPKISFENGLKKTINYYHKLSHGKKS